MIDRDRMRDLFCRLVQIDSVSRRERDVANSLAEHFTGLGGVVEMDEAGKQVGGNAGNLIARFAATKPDAPPFLLCAHMDTQVPGEGIRPQEDGDIIRSDGTTILAADDKSGISIIAEVIQALQEGAIPHGEIEVVITICEEVGLLGAKHLDISRLRARRGLVLDSSDPDTLTIRGPAADRITVTVRGHEAHAGVCPERGLSAIQVAAQAIAAMRLGRIDPETTANVGIIRGGMAINIVPAHVVVRGEARSQDETKLKAQTAHMLRCFEEAAMRHQITVDGVSHTVQVEAEVQRDYEIFNTPEGASSVRLAQMAAQGLGRTLHLGATGGGSDANVLQAKGLEVANLGTGQHDMHTVRESLHVREMVRSAELTLEMVRLNASGTL